MPNIFKFMKRVNQCREERRDYYGHRESISQGTIHMMEDSVRDSWDFVKTRKHKASKIASIPLAVVSTAINVPVLPIYGPMCALDLLLFKCNKKLSHDIDPEIKPLKRNIYS